jgi:outer membrane murein-binding lipoprotein Lpp
MRETVNALHTELVTVKARYDAVAAVQVGLTARLERLETELTQARAAAAGAREEAAQLRGQAEAMKGQQAELMRVIEAREERSGKGGKK